MKTGIYVRVSTDEQVDGFSIKAQINKLTKYAESCDWDIINYYIDEGVSGKNLCDRAEVNHLIDDIKDGIINNVLVYKLDRITRSTKDLIYLIELFEKYNCTFNSQTEKIDTSNAVGRMFIKIIGIFAEFERENLAERISFGYEQKTREGNYTNCNGVYGYDYVNGYGLVINKCESLVVNCIYNWFLDGVSMSEIVRLLSDTPTKRGGVWRVSTIKSILTNPLYIGKVRYGIHKSNKFVVDSNFVEKIITEDIFYKVQNKFTYK